MRLIDVCDINPKAQEIDDSIEVSFVAMPDVSEDGKINIGNIRPYCDVKKGYTCFREGDVLFAKITPCMENGKGALAVGLKNGIGCGSTEFHVLRPHTEVLQGKWLYYLTVWSSFRKDAERHMSGSAGQKRVPKTYLEKYELQIPTLSKQSFQIDTLDHVRAVIELRKCELQSLDELIKARFVEMFGDPEINSIGWKKEPLKDHATVFVGYPFPSEGYTSEGIDIVGGYNLMQGHILWDESKRWPDVAGYEQYLLRANDIVMAMDRPWVNGGFKIARIDASHLPALLIQRTACIRGKDLEQEFLHSLLDTQRFAKHCNITGSLVPHISNKDINSYQVIVPPTEEQRRFTAFVAQVDKSKIAVKKALGEAQTLCDSLMQQYFG